MRADREAAGDRLQALLFDFDGVILESTEIKTRAFGRLFDDPELSRAIVEHHLAHLGISRYEKFAWLYRRRLGREISPRESAELGRRFSELVFDECLRCPLVAGALDLLRDLRRRLPVFVVSGTPQDELDAIVDRRELRPFFARVHGSPPGKAEILRDLIAERGFDPDRLLFVGDGESDFLAATAAGVRFVGRHAEGMPAPGWPPEVAQVADLAELGRRLRPVLPTAAGGG